MNEHLTEQLNLLRKYRDKGCLDTHYKLLIDYIDNLEKENKELHNKIDEISDFIKENKIKRYRVIENEDYDEEIVLDEDDITCLERIINDEYDYENR